MRGKPPKIVIVHFRVIQQWPPWCRSNHYRTLGWCMANLRRREKIIGVRRTRLCAMRSKKCRRSHRAPRRTGPVHGRKVKWIDTDFVFTMSLSCYNIDGQWSGECSERRFKCATSRINLNKIRRKMYDEANVVSGFFFSFHYDHIHGFSWLHQNWISISFAFWITNAQHNLHAHALPSQSVVFCCCCLLVNKKKSKAGVVLQIGAQ